MEIIFNNFPKTLIILCFIGAIISAPFSTSGVIVFLVAALMIGILG